MGTIAILSKQTLIEELCWQFWHEDKSVSLLRCGKVEELPDDLLAGNTIVIVDGESFSEALEERYPNLSIPIIRLYAQPPFNPSPFTLVKPIRIKDLIHTITVAAQAVEREKGIPIKKYIFKPILRQLQLGEKGTPLSLTEKETAIFLHLYHAPQHYSPRTDLLEHIWQYHESVDTHTLETHIYRLRQKIETAWGEKDLVVNKDEGYALVV